MKAHRKSRKPVLPALPSWVRDGVALAPVVYAGGGKVAVAFDRRKDVIWGPVGDEWAANYTVGGPATIYGTVVLDRKGEVIRVADSTPIHLVSGEQTRIAFHGTAD